MSTTRISTAEPEELARAFSLLVKMRKSSKTKIFHRRLRCSDFETVFRQLSVRNTMYYNREQKEKDKALVQMQTDFALVLPVLFCIALDCFRTPTDGLTTEQLLEECQRHPKTCALCCSSTLASTSFNLVVISSRRPLRCRYLSHWILASQRRQGQGRW